MTLKSLFKRGGFRRLYLTLGFVLTAAILTDGAWAAPQRIISTMPSNTEILYELGMGDQVVGVTNFCDYPASAKQKPKIGDIALNYEKIVALEPTLIVMSADGQARDVERLQELGMPVLAVKTSQLEDVAIAATQIGVYTGRPARGLRLALDLVEKTIKTRAEAKAVVGSSKPSAFIDIWHDPLMTATARSLVGNIVDSAGYSNIAGDAAGTYPLYSVEKLLMENPEFIVVPTASIGRIAQVQLDPSWQTLSAVQSQKVMYIDENLLVRASPRAVRGLEILLEYLKSKRAQSNLP